MTRSTMTFSLALPCWAALFLTGLAVDSVAAGQISLILDEAAWRESFPTVEVFSTSAESLQMADELTELPRVDSDLGYELSFPKAATGLDHAFRLTSLSIAPPLRRALVYRDNETGLSGERNISIGEAGGDENLPDVRDQYENDDFEISFSDGQKLTGFGFYLVGNQDSAGESISLYDGDSLVGIIDDTPRTELSESVFIGIVSDMPFDRLVYDDDQDAANVDGDDIAIRDFFFPATVPEPSSAALLLSALAALTLLRSRAACRDAESM